MDILADEDQDNSDYTLKHEAAERIFNLLLFLLANNACTRKEIFEHLASHYRIDRAAPFEQLLFGDRESDSFLQIRRLEEHAII